MNTIRKVFISYRRADNKEFVERIRDWLIHKYQRENVFMDFDGMRAFADFQLYFESKIRECDVVIVIIGPNWVSILKEKEAKSEIDYVRSEIETALKLNKPILPLRILDASMPLTTDLPESLRSLCRIHAPVLNAGAHFLDHIEGVIHDLELAFAEFQRPQPQLSAPELPSAEAYFERGRLRSDKDLDGKIADFTEAIRLKPDFAKAYFRRGNARRKQGDDDNAIADYTTAIRLNPDYTDAYYNRGIEFYRKGRYDDAIADYTEAIRLKPDYAFALNNRGSAFKAKGDLKSAINDWRAAIHHKHPRASEIEGWIADTEAELKRYR